MTTAELSLEREHAEAPALAPRLALWSLFLYIAALPFLWPQVAALPGGKIVVLADLAFVLLSAAVFAAARDRLRPLQQAALWVSVCPVIAMAAAVAGSGAGTRGRLDVCRTGYSMLVFLFLLHYRFSPSERVLAARVWVGTAAVLAAAGLLAYVGVTRFGWPQNVLACANSPNLGSWWFVRIAGTLGSSALGLYLSTAVVLCLWLMGRSRGWMLLVALGLLVVTAFYSFSRSFIGLLVSMALSAYLAEERLPRLWHLRHALAGLAAAFVMAGVIATIWAVVPVRVSRDRQTDTGNAQA